MRELNGRPITFAHFPWSGGTVTAAFYRIPKGVDRGQTEVAFAFCSPKDQWSRKKGCAIAAGRLADGKKMCTTEIVAGVPAVEQIKKLLDERTFIFSRDNEISLPRWSDKAYLTGEEILALSAKP